MGNLEKAGIGVVVVLLAIILVVAFVTDPARKQAQAGPGNQTASTDTDQGDARLPQSPLQRSRSDGTPLRVVTPNPGGLRTVRAEIPEPKVETGLPEKTDPIVVGLDDIAPVAPPLAVPKTSAWPKEVKLADGESLWKVAEREYGKALADRMVPLMQKESGITDARRLAAGTKITLPAPPEVTPNVSPLAVKSEGLSASTVAAKPTPSPAPLVRKARSSGLPFDPTNDTPLVTTPVSAGAGTVYVVKDNDSLASIARRELGSVQRVAEIVKLNGIKDPNRVLAGTRLRLPAKRP